MSQTGRQSAKAARAGGFTLIELIVVMTLLIIVASFGAPLLSGFFRGRSVDSEARRLLGLTRHGQSRAVSEGVPMILWFNVKGREYGLTRDPSWEAEDEKEVQFSFSEDLEMRVATGSVTSNGRNNLKDFRGGLPSVKFLPDGSIDASSVTTIGLQERHGAELWLIPTRSGLGYEIANETNLWNR